MTKQDRSPLDNLVASVIIKTKIYPIGEEPYEPKQRKGKKNNLTTKLASQIFSTPTSNDGQDPLFESEKISDTTVKKLNNKDKQYKKEQRTKILNIINKHKDECDNDNQCSK